MESNVSETGPSNFAFLPQSFQAIAATATKVESHIFGDPRAACFHARFTLESIVHWLYRHDRALQMPYDQKLGALIYEPSFQNLLPQAVYQKTKLIHHPPQFGPVLAPGTYGGMSNQWIRRLSESKTPRIRGNTAPAPFSKDCRSHRALSS